MSATGPEKIIRVLLVEDSIAIGRQISIFLNQSKVSRFTMEQVKELKTAIDRLKTETFDVILLDLGLPDSQGLDTFTQMREQAPSLPIVVFTGTSDEEQALEALRKGAQDYLVKGQMDGSLLSRAIRYSVERKQAEERLIESEEKHRSLLEAMPDICFKISPEGAFTYINKAVEGLGYSADELIGEHFSKLIHPEDLEKVSRFVVLPKYKGIRTGDENAPKLVDERRAGDRMTNNLIFRLIPKEWNEVKEPYCVIGLLTSYGEVTASGHYEKDEETKKKRFLGTVGIIKDITERKRAEDEKAALETQLQQAQKMEAIGRLAGGVAHDMNNVLSAIMGSASVLETEIDPDDHKKADIENILLACRKGRDLTRDLLGFARKGKYVRESISMNDVVKEALGLLGRTIAKSITIKTNLEENLNCTLGDRSQIHHVLMNICINAADAMKGRGRLTINTKNVFLDKSLATKLGGLEPGDYVEVEVIDTGVGMDGETLRMAFEPFFTTKPKGEGTGLGLSMVYGVMKNHGGVVNIDSEPGKGTAVSMHLPAFEQVEQPQAAVEAGRPSIRPDRGGILLVDDEKIVRNSAKRLLERLGYTVFLAEHGEAALKIYKKEKERISLVLLDLIMPEMNGPTAFKELKKMDSDVKVLLLSGYPKDEKIETLLEEGAMGFMQKPFDMQAISEAIKKALG
jgi:PAS domain S-box-containing protein